ncbi:MAG: ABC transporter ATP-binding protein, partial [Moraxellaceae bacterium]
TVLLVSHDRAFLNNIVTSVIAFEGRGNVLEYVGGYDDWLRQGGKWTESDLPEVENKATTAPVIEVASSAQIGVAASQKADVKPAARKKLSYKLQKEFEDLPQKIEQLEINIEAAKKVVSASGFYSQTPTVVDEKLQALAKMEQELEVCFERWAELEDLQQS